MRHNGETAVEFVLLNIHHYCKDCLQTDLKILLLRYVIIGVLSVCLSDCLLATSRKKLLVGFS